MFKNKKIVINRILLLSAIGIIGAYFYVQSRSHHRPHSVDEYWQDSGLDEAHFLSFLDDSKCRESDQYFLACANMIISIGTQIGYSIDPFQGVYKEQGLSIFKNEKEYLQSWVKAKNKRKSFRFSEFWQQLKNKIPTTKMALILGSGINSFFSIMKDPHTYIVPEKYYRDIISKIESRAFHSGVWLKKVGPSVFVRRVLPDSPAALAGVIKGDHLLFIDGVNLNKLTLPQAIEILRGHPGTQAELVIRSNGSTKESISGIKKIRFMRKEFKVPSLSSRFVEAIKPFGVITINKFARGLCHQLKSEVMSLSQQDIRGLVLDLRDNPGGQLEEAACVASLFLGRRKIFELRYLKKDHQIEEYFGQSQPIYSGPLAVLVNSGTASAAEILAGSIQDYQRGILMGQTTFGKGSFQEGSHWNQNGKLVLFETKGLFYLPSGRSPQLAGLDPDLFLKQSESSEAEHSEKEGLIYFSPLKPESYEAFYEKFKRNSRKETFKNCIHNGEMIETLDEELNQAHKYLFCQSTLAKTSDWN